MTRPLAVLSLLALALLVAFAVGLRWGLAMSEDDRRIAMHLLSECEARP